MAGRWPPDRSTPHPDAPAGAAAAAAGAPRARAPPVRAAPPHPRCRRDHRARSPRAGHATSAGAAARPGRLRLSRRHQPAAGRAGSTRRARVTGRATRPAGARPTAAAHAAHAAHAAAAGAAAAAADRPRGSAGEVDEQLPLSSLPARRWSRSAGVRGDPDAVAEPAGVDVDRAADVLADVDAHLQGGEVPSHDVAVRPTSSPPPRGCPSRRRRERCRSPPRWSSRRRARGSALSPCSSRPRRAPRRRPGRRRRSGSWGTRVRSGHVASSVRVKAPGRESGAHAGATTPPTIAQNHQRP